jgi:hypothetical protein
LKDVNRHGFGIYPQRWLPDGPAMTIDTVTVTTAPVYKPGKNYQVVQYAVATGKVIRKTMRSDATGHLHF